MLRLSCFMGGSGVASVDEYLSTTYRPDCDYVDGRVVERNVGELDHSILMARAGAAFFKRGSGKPAPGRC
jgi:hypothetical protein